MIRFLFLGLALALALVGCASRYDQAVEKADAASFEQQPTLFAQFLKDGDITQADYDRWMAGWERNRVKKAEEAKLLASMTPVERAHYMLEKERLEILKEQLALQQEQLEQSQQASQAQSVHNIMSNATSSLQSNQQTLSNMANSQSTYYSRSGR